MRLGTTFSHKYAKQLNLDWQEAAHQIISLPDLQVIRLCAYWDTIQPARDQFDTSWLDGLITLAHQYDKQIVLAIGRKVPRWPEFHEPVWALESALVLHQALLEFIQRLVEYYHRQQIIDVWQVENEPLWDFGQTQYPIETSVWQQMVDWVSNYTNQPVMSTTSGERGDWPATAEPVDVLGINIYPFVYDEEKSEFRSQLIPADIWQAKVAALDKPVWVAELQAEPWLQPGQDILNPSDWQAHFSLQQIKQNLRLVRQVGFDTVLLWGAEWWLAVKQHYGINHFWQFAHQLAGDN